MSRIDLHLHTTHSDGSFSTREVMTFAKQAGVTALAITDHDIVDGVPEAIAIGAELGIEAIPGVEISSRRPAGWPRTGQRRVPSPRRGIPPSSALTCRPWRCRLVRQ